MTASPNNKRFILVMGRISIIVFLVTAVILSGKFTDFLNGPGLVFIILGAVAMSLMGFSLSEIGISFKHAAGVPGKNEELQRSVYFWEAASRNVWILGVMGTVISFVIALSTNEGEIMDISMRMSKSFVMMVYGMTAGVICFVPAMKLNSKISEQQQAESSNGLENPLERKIDSVRFENIIGYILFISLLGWTTLSPLFNQRLSGPLNPLELFVYWPALLVVVGGSTVLVLFMGNNVAGRSFTLSFAFTGLIGSLMGFTQVLFAFSERNIKDVAAAITFIISCCFAGLLGMILVGIPMEDRSVKTRDDRKRLTLSRIAWFVFPLVTLIFLALTFVLVITPIQKGR